MITADPKIISMALISGIVPSLIWLWFWLKEDKKHPEPAGLLSAVFVLGMISVVFVLPVQKFVQNNFASYTTELILWASAEELVKYLAVIAILYKTKYIDEPVDWPIYMLTAALGFAALENMLFLVKPIALGDSVVGLLTGNLRFLGSTLLHAVASAIVGIALGLSFYIKEGLKKYYFIFGMGLAIVLHSVFNFFIMRNDGSDFLQVFSFLWVITIIVLLLFEKLRRMGGVV